MSASDPIQRQRAAWRRLKKSREALFGMIVISLTVVIALFGYFIAPDSSPNANRMIVEIGGRKPGWKQQFLAVKKEKPVKPPGFFSRLLYGKEDAFTYIPVNGYREYPDHLDVEKYVDEGVYDTLLLPKKELVLPVASGLTSRTFLLGTDKFGRDIVSRLIIGARVSLGVGAIAIFISLTIGILLGAIAGYYRGWADKIIMWLINVAWSIPTLLLVFAITFLLGKGFWQIFIAVGLTMWVSIARIVRGQVLSLRRREYIEAARVLGYSDARIIVRHILPNIAGPVIVIAASNFASAILIEAGLSFLGIGVQPPQPSWGLMIKENYNFILTGNLAPALAPGLAIMMLVLAFNLLGNGLRDALNVRNG